MPKQNFRKEWELHKLEQEVMKRRLANRSIPEKHEVPDDSGMQRQVEAIELRIAREERDRTLERLEKLNARIAVLEAKLRPPIWHVPCPECGKDAEVTQDSYLHVAPIGICPHCEYEGQL